MSPESRGRSPHRQEKLSRWPNVGRLERERMGRAWSMMDREQQIIASTRDSLLEEAGRGSSFMRRLNRRVEEILHREGEGEAAGGGGEPRRQAGPNGGA